jgi:predicted transposase/invertase (TIGR01784 family)
MDAYPVSAAQQLRQEGKQEGIQEEKLQVAKSMLQDKEPIDKIAKWTGLSKGEVEKLKN